MKVSIPMWAERPFFNADEAEGWDSCLNEIIRRLEAAGIPYQMESELSPEEKT